MLEDLDDSMQNKTCKYIEMCVLLVWNLNQVILQVFGSKSARKKLLYYELICNNRARITSLLRNITEH